MKSRLDPRHLQRIRQFKKLYSASFRNEKFNSIIDKIILKNAPDWPINKLNKVDLAILRLAVSELKYKKSTPKKVIVDEAIELAKTFGSSKTSKFINGVLGAIIQKK